MDGKHFTYLHYETNYSENTCLAKDNVTRIAQQWMFHLFEYEWMISPLALPLTMLFLEVYKQGRPPYNNKKKNPYSLSQPDTSVVSPSTPVRSSEAWRAHAGAKNSLVDTAGWKRWSLTRRIEESWRHYPGSTPVKNLTWLNLEVQGNKLGPHQIFPKLGRMKKLICFCLHLTC